jgi:hypothetical protein
MRTVREYPQDRPTSLLSFTVKARVTATQRFLSFAAGRPIFLGCQERALVSGRYDDSIAERTKLAVASGARHGSP